MNRLIDKLVYFHCPGVCPHDSCLLAVIRGFRNGLLYGAKVRLPHATVMTFVFHNGTFEQKIKSIFNATKSHSITLGCFAAFYKFVYCTMRHLTKKKSPINVLVAGFCAALLMFGKKTPVTSQINMYVFSRVVLGLARYVCIHFSLVFSFSDKLLLFIYI